MRFSLVVGPLKNTLAAEKMVYLATGGNPMGEGKGRGVRLWGILMVLSLVVCKISGVPPADQSSTERQSLTDECEQCLQTILKGQEAPKVMAYRAKYDCQSGTKRGHCTYNSTRYKVCKLEGGIVCHNPKVISKDGQSETSFTHTIHKWDTGRTTTIPICNQYRSVKLLELIATWNRLEKVLPKLQPSSSEDSSSFIGLSAREDDGVIPPVPAPLRRAGQPAPFLGNTAAWEKTCLHSAH
ncbi:hypothetical protein HGM15179_019597 [Zosterops borbonicus]|uniref:Uncharacterized protein n=1 Tax=Zosterops borbonicus TaxID=364589 RepID=A0A8K1D8H2_9PASS|nr:hypothetical protein HGM15179_019597 [Zosterops borbonicus]